MAYTTAETRRKNRTRARINHFSDRVRLSVYRSNKHIYAQLIDVTGKTIASSCDEALEKKLPKTEAAFEVGKDIAAQAIKKGVKEVVFDRGGYRYHGRVKAVCDGAREGKLVI